MIFLFLIIISFLLPYPIFFTNRIFTIGRNFHLKLCSVGNSFSCSSKKRVENYPGEVDCERKEIIEIRNTYTNSFFRTIEGKIYSTGGEKWSISGTSGVDEIYIPREVNFPFESDSNQKIVHIFPLSYAGIFCSSSFEECFGGGWNDYCCYMGCVGRNTLIDPVSIFTEILSNYTKQENTKKIRNIFTGRLNTMILFQDTVNFSSPYSLYGTGKNEYGVLSINSVSIGGEGWVEMNAASIFHHNETIKLAAFFSSSVLFIITESNKWFFSGKTEYSGCKNQFVDDNILLLTEMPQDGTCGYNSSSLNEVLGKNITDLQCSPYFCVAMTNESKLYSWEADDDRLYIGRHLTSENVYVPMEVNSTRFNALQLANDIEIEGLFVQLTYTFITVMDHTENRKRIFGFGDDSSSYFDFSENSYYYMIEVFTEYQFTSSLLLSTGNSNPNSVFLLDSSTCWGKQPNDSSVCGGEVGGYCYDFDECFCDEGYAGDTCIPYCFNILANDSSVCNGNGNCTAYDTCECFLQQEGVSSNCTYPVCFGKRADDPSVCSGHGKCFSTDSCACEDDRSGENCEESSANVGLILGISISSFAVACICIALLSLCFLCFIIFCVVLCFVPIFTFYMKNRKKMKTFKSIKNIDLIMEEQELEERMDIAHLKINKQLFQIEMKDIKLKKILGEGGSNSIVYLVLWHGKDAAFKCFKTRSICSEQQNFDEFEKEVEILGSISHPNIIRYFGACLDPSRTGFVMEYCSNGDLNYFVALKKRKQEVFELSEKIRMFQEIASAMCFLHSKKIIHRDLKPENVLLDSTLTCKLMDFGASKFYEQTKMNAHMTKGVGTSYFMSPEIVLGRSYSSKVDVFSFGILMFVLLTEELNPYQNMETATNIEYQVANNPSFRPKFEGNHHHIMLKKKNNILQELCRKCWSHDPEERPSFDDILKSFEEEEKSEDQMGMKNSFFLFSNNNEEEEKEDGDEESKIEKREEKKEKITEKEFAFLENMNEQLQKDIQKMKNELKEMEELKEKNVFLKAENERQNKEIENLRML